ncbi:MAG TPA: DnaB-like helicase N-terminal domain-containing protein, partial [Pirellula sp.]|nr:DnaB-like helicase N-terminal domain-containing protein [Pirellula sp.]
MVIEQKRLRKDDSIKGKKPQSSNILDRSPPFDLSAEMGVLGSLILNPDVANDLALEIRADDFYDDAHRKLYAAMMNMFDSGRKMDVTLLVSELKTAGDYELIGGAGYLAKLANSVP